MAAFDFPPTPAVGTLYPLVAEVGKPQYRWNGSEWIAATLDPAGYVRKSGDSMSGALSLAGDPTQALHAVPKQYLDAQRQRISLAGVNFVDVQVPANAIAARINGMATLVAASPLSYPVLQLSVAPGVFRNTAGDYQMSGFQHTSLGGAVIANHQAVATIAGMMLTQGCDHIGIPMTWEGVVLLKRKSTSTAFFSGDFRGSSFSTANGHFHTFLQNLLLIAAAGSALNVLAFRLVMTSGAVLDADSYLQVEWVY